MSSKRLDPTVVGGLPRLLYHYASAKGLIGILEGKSLWATDALFLNDRTEGSYGLDIVTDVLANTLATAPASDGWLDVQSAWKTVTTARARAFVTSLSVLDDDLSQWRGYCPNGGFSLGFDTGDLSTAWLLQA